MRLHRFYVAPDQAELDHSFWLKDERLRHQWQKVLRFAEGSQVVLFDGVQHERLYRINRIESDAIQLELVTEFERTLPSRHVYLFFSLLKKDKNEWVLQKATELGVRNFVPIIADRSEKTGFDVERALKIAIEAAEQCGRSDIPDIREPLQLETALKEYDGKVAMFVSDGSLQKSPQIDDTMPAGVFIGPEGGWSEAELKLFESHHLQHLHLGSLTLRAETAAVAASVKLLQ